MLATLITLLFTRKGSIGSLIVEATLSENHEASSKVTLFPIENGFEISDHIINEPQRVTIEGFISDTPLDGFNGNNAQNAFDTLYEMRDNKELISVITGFKVYENMAITNISVPRDTSTGKAIRFSVELVEVVKVGSSSLDIFGLNLATVRSIADQASSPMNLGRSVLRTALPSEGRQSIDIARGIL